MHRLTVFLIALCLGSPASAETLRVLALRTDAFFYETEGRPAGIEYDILEYFTKTRGLELDVEWVESFPELLDRIAKGEGEIAAGTITITPQRAERLEFSAPYFPVQVVLVEQASARTRSLDELAGRKVGAFRETTAEEALKRIEGVQVVDGASLHELLERVERGELRAAAGDSSSIMRVLGDYPSLKMGLAFGEEQSFGFALPKNSAWKAPISEHIVRLKETGIFYRIVTEHLGPKATEIVRAARQR